MKLKLRRLLAFYIDSFIIGAVAFPIMNIIMIFLDKIINTFINFNLSSSNYYMVIVFIVYIPILYYFFINKDSLFGYSSIGKKILGISIVSQDGSIKLNKKLLVKRNIKTIESFPLYIFDIIIDNKSVGDKEFNTKIIKIK